MRCAAWSRASSSRSSDSKRSFARFSKASLSHSRRKLFPSFAALDMAGLRCDAAPRRCPGGARAAARARRRAAARSTWHEKSPARIVHVATSAASLCHGSLGVSSRSSRRRRGRARRAGAPPAPAPTHAAHASDAPPTRPLPPRRSRSRSSSTARARCLRSSRASCSVWTSIPRLR